MSYALAGDPRGIEFEWCVPSAEGTAVANTLSRILGFSFYDWEIIDATDDATLVRFTVADSDAAANIIHKLRAAV